MDRPMAMTSDAEREFLAECAAMAPDGHFVELGPWMGATTISIARVANERDAEFLTIDRFTAAFGLNDNVASSPDTVRENLAAAGIDPLPRIVEGDSSDVPEGIESVAFLFIDTEHTADVVCQELDAWLPLLLPDAVLALHDYGWTSRYPDYTPAIDRRLRQDGDWAVIGQVGYMAGFQRGL